MRVAQTQKHDAIVGAMRTGTAVERHDAHHAWLVELADERENAVGTTRSLRFRRLGDLLAKNERPVGMIVDGTFDLVEFIDANGQALLTDEERAAITQQLQREHLDDLETQLLG